MTKNNRFKKVVRAYQHSFDVPYMTALNAVSQPFIITPEMEKLAEKIRGLKQGGLILITGRAGAGKTYLQHYLAQSLWDSRVIEQDKEDEIEKFVAPLLLATKENLSKEEILDLSQEAKNKTVNSVLMKGEALERLSTETRTVLKDYLRLRPDAVSLPEIRGNESRRYLEELQLIFTTGTLLLTSIHTTSPTNVFDRLYTILIGKETIKEVLEFKHLMKGSLIIDVNRASVDGKSLLNVSEFYVDEEVMTSWRQGTLGSLLNDKGFVSAQEKTQQMIDLL